MNLVTGRDKICGEIAAALGIKHCKALTLDMRVNDIVSIQVEFSPEIDQVKQVGAILKTYNIKLVEEKEQP